MSDSTTLDSSSRTISQRMFQRVDSLILAKSRTTFMLVKVAISSAVKVPDIMKA